jgi:hypothetical protein
VLIRILDEVLNVKRPSKQLSQPPEVDV